uniref:Oxysterol-binding protein n=1 Tax=Hymenolepis diminuta TaxID=6216 RepID=A0A158QDM3_HYMDI
LGKWNEDAHLKWVKQSSLRKPQFPLDKRVKITQFYSDGDYCGEIKAPRTVRLSFVCQVKVSTNVQLSFSEPSTCQYSISLESPLFCDLLKHADENGLFPSGVEARFRRISSANQGEVIHQMTDETSANLKGYLLKWTNYLKGYQKRWFVLQNGLLSYYRGTINLANAKIVSAGHLTLVISNSSTQTFHLKATNEMEQKKWMAALTMGKANALSLGKSGNDSDDWDEADDDESDLAWSAPRLMPEDAAKLVEGAISNFESRIGDLQHYQDTLKRKADELQKVINDLEGSDISSDLAEKISIVQDRATVYKVASLAMANSCSDFLEFARSQMRRWRKIFNTQVDRRARLEQMVEELAKQINKLESQVRSKSMNPGKHYTFFPFFFLFSVIAFYSHIVQLFHAYCLGDTLFLVNAGNWGIPGQAVAVRRTSAETARARGATLSSNHGNSVRLTTDGSSSGPPGISSAIASEDEEDDFYDAAEDAGADEFDVILPSTNSCPYPGPLSQTAAEKEGMVDARQSQTSDVPVGADVNMEYESDIEDSDTDDQGKGQQENRAHVIQKHAWGKAGRSPKETGSSSYAGPSRSAPEKRIIPVRKPVQRRTSIPPKPNISLNLWSFLSNCIGKELTKIPMPVQNFEYSYVLDRAAACTNPLEQLAYVSAFVVSSYASTALRVAKPFNPLLNETYECDRTDDLGWRSVAEQVSHHPPVAAFHCESDLWYTWFDFSISTKFRGRYLQIKVNGVCHLVFRKTGYHYTWTKIPLTVHNIIVGRLWIENSGEIDIINHTTGDKCHLTFKQYSYFSSEVPRRVTGAVTDKTGKVHGIIGGTWDEFIEYAPVITDNTGSSNKHVIETGPPVQLWRVSPLPPGADKMYNFTQFAMQLNNRPEDEPNLCPTDSRLRPDQRLMEEGLWDEANAEKVRLEEKQRMRRREMALKLLGTDGADSAAAVGGSVASSTPLPAALMGMLITFPSIVVDEDTGLETLKFNGKYWKCKEKNDWSVCPDLY